MVGDDMINGKHKWNNVLLNGLHINIAVPGTKVTTASRPKLNSCGIAVTAPARGLTCPQSVVSKPQGLKANTTTTTTKIHLRQSWQLVDFIRGHEGSLFYLLYQYG